MRFFTTIIIYDAIFTALFVLLFIRKRFKMSLNLIPKIKYYLINFRTQCLDMTKSFMGRFKMIILLFISLFEDIYMRRDHPTSRVINRSPTLFQTLFFAIYTFQSPL